MTDSPVTHQLRDDLSIDQQLALKTAATRLHGEFDGTFGTETIERFLCSSYDQFAGRATIPNFLPLLAERFARQRLHALARVEGKISDGKPTVLFLCTHNAGRSQMALGYFTHYAGDNAIAWSGVLNPETRSTRPRSLPWPRSVSTSPVNTPNPGPTKSWLPPTLSSPWAAGTPARSSPENATRIGNCPTRPAKASTLCAQSATKSTNASTNCWPS